MGATQVSSLEQLQLQVLFLNVFSFQTNATTIFVQPWILKRDDFFAYVYFSNFTVGFVWLRVTFDQ